MSDQSKTQQGSTSTADEKKKEVPVRSNTPDNKEGKLNPSSPEGANTAPGPDTGAVTESD